MAGRSFAKDSLSVYGTKLFLAVAALLSKSLVSRTMGPTGASLYATAVGSAILVNSFANLGINRALTVTFSAKKYDTKTFFGNALGSLIFTSALSMIALYLLFLGNGADRYGWDALTLAILCVPFMLTTEFGNGVFLATGYMRGFNGSQIQRYVGFLVALVVCLFLLPFVGIRNDEPMVTGAFLVGSICGALSPILRLRPDAWTLPRFDPAVQRDFLVTGAQFAVTMFILQLSYRLDVQLLNILAKDPLTDVGIYDNGVTLVETLWQIPTAVGTVLIAKSVHSDSEQEAVDRACKVMRTVLPLVAIGAVILAIIAPAVVWVFYGSQFMPSVDATRLLLPGIVMGSIYKVLGADLAARGKPLYAAWAYGFAVILNVALNFYLIPRYGFRGAAVASSISYSFGSLLYLGIYVKNHNIRLADAVVPRASDFDPITRKLKKLIKRR